MRTVTNLELVDVQYSESLLKNLAIYFETDTRIPSLKKLKVVLLRDNWMDLEIVDEPIDALERLLASFLGLEELTVDPCAARFVDAGFIERHHETLKLLRLSSGGPVSTYNDGDIQSFKFRCRKLETLEINAPSICLVSESDTEDY